MPGRILVIDDDPLTRNRICSFAQQRDFICDQATSEAEAMIVLDSAPYELILLDLMLPDENGFRVLEHLRARFPEQTHHLIVMTNADPKFVSNLPAEGWCAVLVKPFAISEMERIFDLCLQGAHRVGSMEQQ
jgi:DNA-binding response OmpR family regulator